MEARRPARRTFLGSNSTLAQPIALLARVDTELANFQYCLANTKLQTHNVIISCKLTATFYGVRAWTAFRHMFRFLFPPSIPPLCFRIRRNQRVLDCFTGKSRSIGTNHLAREVAKPIQSSFTRGWRRLGCKSGCGPQPKAGSKVVGSFAFHIDVGPLSGSKACRAASFRNRSAKPTWRSMASKQN